MYNKVCPHYCMYIKNNKIEIKCRQFTALQAACDDFDVCHTWLATGAGVVALYLWALMVLPVYKHLAAL